MMTIDIKINGQCIASADITNLSALAEVSDYKVLWDQQPYAAIGIEGASGKTLITGHHRSHGAWALAAKVVVAILGQMAGAKTKP